MTNIATLQFTVWKKTQHQWYAESHTDKGFLQCISFLKDFWGYFYSFILLLCPQSTIQQYSPLSLSENSYRFIHIQVIFYGFLMGQDHQNFLFPLCNMGRGQGARTYHTASTFPLWAAESWGEKWIRFTKIAVITSVYETRKLLSAELKAGAALGLTDTGPPVSSVQQTGSQKETLLYQIETMRRTID